MKLLFVTEFFPADNKLIFTGGVEAYNYFLIEELAKRHQITVICRRFDAKKDVKRKYQVIRVGPTPSKIDTGVSTIPQRLLFSINTTLIALKQDFDLVQGNNFVTYLPAFFAGILKRKPTVAWYPDVFIGKWLKLTGFLSGILGEFTEKT